jgi:hypothetical protein
MQEYTLAHPTVSSSLLVHPPPLEWGTVSEDNPHSDLLHTPARSHCDLHKQCRTVGKRLVTWFQAHPLAVWPGRGLNLIQGSQLHSSVSPSVKEGRAIWYL